MQPPPLLLLSDGFSGGNRWSDFYCLYSIRADLDMPHSAATSDLHGLHSVSADPSMPLSAAAAAAPAATSVLCFSWQLPWAMQLYTDSAAVAAAAAAAASAAVTQVFRWQCPWSLQRKR